ncbi:MAG: hypothetical protein QM737_21740 [Ferruginibacter sp.]
MKTFDKKLFIVLFFAFIAATVIGTLSHESGHYFTAKYWGYDARIGYGYTALACDTTKVRAPHSGFYITLAGPLQTVITGTIGFVLLIVFRSSFFNKEKLAAWQWLLIFIALFWLRQPANLFTYVLLNIIGEDPGGGDETSIAYHFQIPEWTIITSTGIIGAAVLLIIILKFIPVKQRLTFIISGLVGGLTGGYLWLGLLGKYILP